VTEDTQSGYPSPPLFLILSLLLNYNNVDNAVLASLLPGIVEGTIDLVLRNQGPRSSKECADEEKDSSLLPGAFKLLIDESKEFEFVRPHQSVLSNT
jgi:hypothetical protein